ncbi:MAG: hypothetical protein M3N30_01625 [Bacteroidota bacterium]|nr:hypothetical protein [Bacteroidota bacterium]
MLRPFEQFTGRILVRLMKLERPYLVTQTYHRAAPDEDGKIPLLVTEYSEPGGAKIHLNAVKADKYAAIIDLNNERHKMKLEQMLTVESPYRIFFAVVPSTKGFENQINNLYRENVKRYIDRQTNWRLNRSNEIKASVQLTFGELFIILKHLSQTIRVRLADIEAME